MVTENTNRGAHPEPCAEQDPVPSSVQDLSVSLAFNPSNNTADDVRSSASSDKSDSKPPRSAMRRMSSISKLPQSPRRVRFDFMGEEVLPTSSPQPSVSIAARTPSPEPTDDEPGCTSNLATDPGEDEEEPSSLKVSSSDALRALSRAPLDEDGTVWTVVNSDSEEFATNESVSTQSHQAESPDASSITSAAVRSPASKEEMNMLRNQTSSKTTTFNTVVHDLSNSEDDSTDEDDILSMAKHKTSPSLSARAPSMPASSNSNHNVALGEIGGKSSRRTNSKRAGLTETRDEAISVAVPALVPEEEGIFHFEEEGLEFPERASDQTSEEEEQNEPEEDLSDHEMDTSPPRPASLFARSPAIPIPRQMQVLVDSQSMMPSTIRYKPMSLNVGSYKGQPLIMPVVRNAELMEEILSSERERSSAGFQPSTLQKIIEERLAAGPPRSLSERLMIEDMMEAVKNRPRTSGV
ncbi:hypothetical protein E4U41_006793 [Claviceps citrina]|nr:hypothetical protein E4U41_006793 [Claviceps citrina]